MHTTLLPPKAWARLEFGMADLHDQRRNRRLVHIVERLVRNPGGVLTASFSEWNELKGAYRLFSRAELVPQDFLQGHWERTCSQCREPGTHVLLEDNTELDYSGHPRTEGLGPIGRGHHQKGLVVHSTLAVRVESWDRAGRAHVTLSGLLDHRSWVRPKKGRRQWESGRQRLRRQRESQAWTAVLDRIGGPPAGSQWIYVADRESDFYEPIQRCEHWGLDYVIRNFHNRLVAGGQEHLHQLLAQAPVRRRVSLELPARGGQAARVAQVEVRWAEVRLKGPWRPEGWQEDFVSQVVEVREPEAPLGVEALHWVLLSSLPCRSWEQAHRVLAYYRLRWLIEEYHKALKSGTKAEESDLRRAYRLQSLVAVLAVVAVRLLNTKLLARTRPEEVIKPESVGPELLAILAAKFGAPEGPWTHKRLLVGIARLGGYPARRRDGPPGWQTIWRGWHRLMWMCEGLELVKIAEQKCG